MGNADEGRVFGIGLSRTGTTSLAKALNLLEIRTIHYPYDRVTHSELNAGDYELSLLKQYQAITDITAAPFYSQLDEAYPCSKFILTLREKQSWLRSMQTHLERVASRMTRDEQFRKFTTFISEIVYGTVQFDKSRLEDAYDTHVTRVTDYFRERTEDLLLLDICAGDGWEKLCPFLDRPIPDVPFPHRNSGQATATWDIRISQAQEELASVIAPEESFILVGHQYFPSDFTGGRKPIPFLEKDGEYWGTPANADSAIAEVERLKAAGANFLVFAWPAFWYLDYYTALHQHLCTKYCRILEDDRLIIFSLRQT